MSTIGAPTPNCLRRARTRIRRILRNARSARRSGLPGACSGNLSPLCRPVQEAVQVASTRSVRRAAEEGSTTDSCSASEISMMRRLGPRKRYEARRVDRVADQEAPKRKSADLLAVCGHSPLSSAAVEECWSQGDGGCHRRDGRPTSFAWRFSPDSNNKRDKIKPEDELRVLVATDVLSEGQNLQDGAILVNYDLPWRSFGLSSVRAV